MICSWSVLFAPLSSCYAETGLGAATAEPNGFAGRNKRDREGAKHAKRTRRKNREPAAVDSPCLLVSLPSSSRVFAPSRASKNTEIHRGDAEIAEGDSSVICLLRVLGVPAVNRFF